MAVKAARATVDTMAEAEVVETTIIREGTDTMIRTVVAEAETMVEETDL
jgi:hypothetical protein